MSTKDGGAAFPVHGQRWDRSTGFDQAEFPGMTLRDYFAAKAMPMIREGIAASFIAARAYELADAMLAERAK